MEQKVSVIYKNSIRMEKILKYLLRKHSLLSNNRLAGYYKAISPHTIKYLENANYRNLCTSAKLLHIQPNMNDAHTEKEKWSLDLDNYYIRHNFNAIATAKHFNKIKYRYNRTFVSDGTVKNNHYKRFHAGKSISIADFRLFETVKALIDEHKHICMKSYNLLECNLVKILKISKYTIGSCLGVLRDKGLITITPNKVIIDLPSLKKFYHQIDLREPIMFKLCS